MLEMSFSLQNGLGDGGYVRSTTLQRIKHYGYLNLPPSTPSIPDENVSYDEACHLFSKSPSPQGHTRMT